MKTAIYTRVSHEEQVNGHSLHQQYKECEKFATNNGLNNIVLYTDEGRTARNMNRKELKELIRDIETNNIKNLIVYELDRLSRNIADSEYLMNLILLKSINFYTVADAVKVENADDRLMFRFKMAIAQHTSEKIGEKTISGIKGGLSKGIYSISTVPYGYVKEGDKLVPVHKELKVVKKIFDLYLVGNSILDIENLLGIKQARVSSILKNSKYTGTFNYRGSYYDNLGLIETVSKEDFNAVQNKTKVNRKSKKYIYLFDKKLVCSHCNSLLKPKPTVKKSKVYLYYTCSNTQCIASRKLINEDNLIIKFHAIIKKAIMQSNGEYTNKKININDYKKHELRCILKKYMSEIKVKI